MQITLEGAANDYVGKGLSGGTIILRPHANSPIAQEPHQHIIIGNTCLYGATSGDLFAAGAAGNRFAIRLSGARAVVEGAGDNACEYMTGGEVILLGPVGYNFAAGMSGGTIFVYDPDQTIRDKINPQSAAFIRPIPEDSAQADALHARIQTHLEHTGSAHARRLLEDWESTIAHFHLIAPEGSAGS